MMLNFQVADMLNKFLMGVSTLGDQKNLWRADLILEAIEMASGMLKKIEYHHWLKLIFNLGNHRCSPTRLRTQHDFLHQETREMMIKNVRFSGQLSLNDF